VLPAFTNCSLDSSPGDGDFRDAEKQGGVNGHQIWEPETIVDDPDRCEITVGRIAAGRSRYTTAS